MRAVLVVPDFHPSAHVGAIRWSTMAPLLAERGLELHLVAPDHPWLVGADPSELEQRGVQSIHLLPRPPRGTVAKVRRLAHQQHILGRAAPHWCRQAPRVREVAESVGADLVITSAPWHALHLIGLELAAGGFRWVADFRDPYLGDVRYRPPWPWRRFGRRSRQFDRAVHERAWLVVHAIGREARAACARHPDLAGKIAHVPNGAPLERVAPAPPVDAHQELRVTVAGKYGERQLLDLASALTARSAPTRLRILGPKPPAELARRTSPHLSVESPGFVAHDVVLEAISEPGILASLLDRARGASGGLSSKLFEFVATGNPILAVNPTEADRDLLADYPRAVICRSEPAELTTSLARLLARPPLPPDLLEELRHRYSKEHAAELMWAALTAEQPRS